MLLIIIILLVLRSAEVAAITVIPVGAQAAVSALLGRFFSLSWFYIYSECFVEFVSTGFNKEVGDELGRNRG